MARVSASGDGQASLSRRGSSAPKALCTDRASSHVPRAQPRVHACSRPPPTQASLPLAKYTLVDPGAL